MKRIISILLLALPATLMAELVTERQFEHVIGDVAGDGIVEVDNIAGSITIHGTDRNEVRVKAKLGKNVEGVEFEQSKNSVSIQVRHDKSKDHHGGADLEIWLPRDSELDITGVSADIEVDAVRGEQRLKSVSGEIETESLGANVSAASVSGDVVVAGKGEANEVRIESVSGDVGGTALNGDIDAKSVSGDVEIRGAQVTRGRFSSTSGDVDIEASIGTGSRIDFETVSGDLTFTVVGEKDGSYDFSTFSGDIENCFGPEAEKSGSRRRLRFGVGNEKARIRAGTMSGDIVVCD